MGSYYAKVIVTFTIKLYYRIAQILALAWFLFIGSDVLSYLKIGHERIDMNEWRFEKFHGLNRRKRVQIRPIERKIPNRFVYKASGGDHSF